MNNNQPTAAEVAAHILAPIAHDSAQARSEKVLYIAKHAAILATGYLDTKDKLDHLEDASTLYYQQSCKQLEDARAEIEQLKAQLAERQPRVINRVDGQAEIERLRAVIKAHYDKCLWVLDGLEMQGQWNNADYELWKAIGIDAEKGGEG